MILFAIFLAFVIGCIVGAFWQPEEDCPSAVLGYDCQGDRCDHRKSQLYSNMAVMARHAEKREQEQNKV